MARSFVSTRMSLSDSSETISDVTLSSRGLGGPGKE